jgi:hypothetical protein
MVKESLYDLEKALFARVWYDPQMKSRQVVQKSISFRTGSGDAAEAAEAAAEAAVDLVKKCLPSVADARRAQLPDLAEKSENCMGNLRRIASEFGAWPCLEAVRAAGGTVRRRSLTASARRVGPALPLSRLGPLLPASPLPGLSAGAPDSASLRQVRMLAEDMSKAGANIQSQKYKAWFKVHDDECEDEDGRLPSSDGEEEDETPPAGVASSWHPEMRPGPVSSVEGCSALRRGAGPAADCSRPCLPSRGVQAGARRAEAASGAPPPRTSASTSRVANRSHDAVCRAGRAAQRAEHRAHHRDREPRELSEHRALAASVLGEGREAAPTPAGRGRAGQRYADLRLEAQTCRRLLLLTPICYSRLGPRVGTARKVLIFVRTRLSSRLLCHLLKPRLERPPDPAVPGDLGWSVDWVVARGAVGVAATSKSFSAVDQASCCPNRTRAMTLTLTLTWPWPSSGERRRALQETAARAHRHLRHRGGARRAAVRAAPCPRAAVLTATTITASANFTTPLLLPPGATASSALTPRVRASSSSSARGARARIKARRT